MPYPDMTASLYGPNTMPFERVLLKKMEVAVQQHCSELSLMDVQMEAVQSRLANGMALRLRAFIMGEDTTETQKGHAVPALLR